MGKAGAYCVGSCHDDPDRDSDKDDEWYPALQERSSEVAGEWECMRGTGFASDPHLPHSSKLHHCDGLGSRAVAFRQGSLICWVATCLIAPHLDCNGLTV